MRPLRLTMTAFGPYAETEVVDFELLADLGLFAVAGRNGSGKTTIFDGLYFALYGSLPGRRATYHRLRSDHARPDLECRVELDFVAHGERWRIERFPKQRRAKRRGSGQTESPQRATLWRVDDQPVAIVNRVNEVNARCRELVGLSGPQFERVALLPQGEFSRLLRESSAERRELLRALFSSDVFGDATDLLVADASRAGRDDELITARLDDRLADLAREVAETTGAVVDAEPVAIAEAIDAHDDAVLARLSTEVDELHERAQRHAIDLQQAHDLCDRIDRRNATLQQLHDHDARRSEVDRDKQRLDRGRAAVPVVDIATVVEHQFAADERAHLRVAEIQQWLTPALARLGLPIDVPSDADQLEALTITIDRLGDDLAAVIAARTTIRALQRQIRQQRVEHTQLERSAGSALEQRELLARRRDQLEAECDQIDEMVDVETARAEHGETVRILELRRELAALDRRHETDRADLRTIELEGAAIADRIEAAERAQAAQAEHNAAAHDAGERLRELERRRTACRRFDQAAARLADLRHELARAQRTSDETFDAFIRGASARLAETLADGDPCAVCGATEHPSPARPSDESVSEHDVAAARATLDRVREQTAHIEHELGSLRSTDADIAEIDRGGFDDTIRDATAQALAAENRANETARVVASLAERRRQRAAIDERAVTIRSELDQLDAGRNRILGALGDRARAALDELAAVAEHAARIVREAEGAHQRRRAVATELDDIDRQIETVDLARLDVERRLAASSAELDARTDDLAVAEQRLDAAGDQAFDDPEATHELARRALRRLGELRAAFAERDAAADSLRRAELTLREKLTPSPFLDVADARRAFLETDVIAALEASTTAWSTRNERLRGELEALGDLPDIRPDVEALRQTAHEADAAWQTRQRHLAHQRSTVDRLRHEVTTIAEHLHATAENRRQAQRLERVAALVKGDNDHNTSLENWVLAAHLRDVVDLANVRLAQSTQQRFQLCVLDDGEHRRGRWGLDLAVEDTVTGTRRPTAGLSGGELFQASLALALGLADVVMSQTAGVRIDALFIDEGFGSLDDVSVERVIDLLDDVRSRGATVGVITHVRALLDALPRGITVTARSDGNGSTIQQPQRAA